MPHCRDAEGAYPGLFRLMRDFCIGQVGCRWMQGLLCRTWGFTSFILQIDNGKFEDECRLLLGTNSYELFTLDKVRLP